MADEKIEIARRLRRRDPELLDRLIETYQNRLLRYLVHLTGRRELAEDLFQETWLRVLERGHQYDGRHEFAAWLFMIARNLAIDHLRRLREIDFDHSSEEEDGVPFEPPASGQPSPFDLTMQAEQRERISAGIGCLPLEYREALVLRFQEEMPLEEIANVTGAPLSTVKSRIYRGLSALERLLKGGQR